jgi:hypothetical protein
VKRPITKPATKRPPPAPAGSFPSHARRAVISSNSFQRLVALGQQAAAIQAETRQLCQTIADERELGAVQVLGVDDSAGRLELVYLPASTPA